MGFVGFVLAQTEAPEPLLPDDNNDLWLGIGVLTVIVLLVAVAVWLIWRYVRETRRTADRAMDAVIDLRSQIANDEG